MDWYARPSRSFTPSGPGRPGVIAPADIEALQQARDSGGCRDRRKSGRLSFPDSPDKAARADDPLRENVKYALGESEIGGSAAVL